MVELSDWIWLAVVALWIVLRILPRLFRARASQQPKPKRRSARASSIETAWQDEASAGRKRKDDTGPDPIEPK